MTAKEIQSIIGKEQVLKGHLPVCENVKYLFSSWENDVISLSKNGYLYEFEVKVSRQDFHNDKKKIIKHRFFKELKKRFIPNYFYYVCPLNLIKLNEIPEYSGLIYILKNNTIKVIKKCKLLHKYKHSKDRIYKKVLNIYSQRQFLGCCLMTYKNKLIENENNITKKII